MKKMTTGQKAVSFLGGAVPSFADTFFKAQAMLGQQQAQRTAAALGQGRLALGQGRLVNDFANTGLRGGELEEKIANRGSMEQRAAEANKLGLFKSLAGGYGQHNPQGYTEALAAPPQDFGQLMGAAQGLAQQNQATQSGRLAGTRAGAGAAAKSAQKSSDNERIRLTEQYRREGTLDQQVAQGFKPFSAAPRNAGQDLGELRAATGIRQLGKTLAHARRLSASGQMVPQSVALQAAREQIELDPAQKQAFDAADVDTKAEMLKEIVGNHIGFENIAPE